MRESLARFFERLSRKLREKETRRSPEKTYGELMAEEQAHGPYQFWR